jgi:hypothetical protein
MIPCHRPNSIHAMAILPNQPSKNNQRKESPHQPQAFVPKPIAKTISPSRHCVPAATGWNCTLPQLHRPHCLDPLHTSWPSIGQSDLSPTGRGTGTEVGRGATEGGRTPWGGIPVPIGKGGVPVPMGWGGLAPVGYGWATLMGEAAAKAQRAARRGLVYILVVC